VIDDVLAPEVLTTSQWRDLHRTANGQNAGIKRLMLALIEISLRDATGARKPQRGHPAMARYEMKRAAMKQSSLAKALRRDARAWLFDRDADGPFSFVTVCDVLGIDGEELRARLAGGRRHQIAKVVRGV
jgi:hypothetical protein